MRFLLSVFFPLFLAAEAHAGEQPPRIAVFNIEAKVGIDQKVADVLSDILLAKVRAMPGCVAIGMNDIEKMLTYEQEKQRAGCAEDSCMVEIAGALGVDKMITGSIAKLGTSSVFTLKLMNVRKASTEAQYTNVIGGATEEDFLKEVGTALNTLFPEATADKAAGKEKAPAKAGQDVAVKAPEPGKKPSQPVSEAQAAPAKNELGHAGQLGLSVMGTVTFEHWGRLPEVRLSYGLTHRIEAGLNVFFANNVGLRPLVLVNIKAEGAFKLFVTAGPLVFFAGDTAFGAGGSAGAKYDLSRHFGLFVELPAEYFFSIPKPYQKLNLMASAGIEGRL